MIIDKVIDFNIVPDFFHVVDRKTDPTWEIKLRSNDFHNFMYIITGDGFIFNETERISLKPGMFIYQKPNVLYGYETNNSNPFHCFGMNFYMHTSKQIDENFTINKNYILPIDRITHINNKTVLEKLLKDLVNIWDEKAFNYMLNLNINFQKVVLFLFDETKKLDKTIYLIDNVKKYIQNNYNKKIHTQELADFTKLNKNYFTSLFKKYTGKTPVEYINSIRIEKSKELLQIGYNVAQSSFNVGFEDQFYFSRVFKKETGISPAAFIKNPERYF